MAIIKCTSCGTLFEAPENKDLAFCHNCGTKHPIPKNNLTDNLIKRGFMALEDKEWIKANDFFEHALNLDPENGSAYLGKLMIDLRVHSFNDLKNYPVAFDSNNNYKKAVRFGSDELISELLSCTLFIINRNNKKTEFINEQNTENKYLLANKLAKSTNIDDVDFAAEIFTSLGDYKDSAELAEKHLEKADKLHDSAKKQGLSTMKFLSAFSIVLSLIIIVSILFSTLIIPTINFNKGKDLVEEGHYEEALVYLGKSSLKKRSEYYAKALENVVSRQTLATNYYHTLAINNDDTVITVCNCYYPCDFSEWKDIVAVDCGVQHTIGLKSDGTVIANGDKDAYSYDFYYYNESVTDWVNIVAISAGKDYTVGLKSNGTVVALGDNTDDKCSVSEWENIIAIDAGNDHTVGLKTDGTVVATGCEDYYTNSKSRTNKSKTDTVENWENIVAIAAGNTHTVGLKDDGTVVAMGSNDKQQCDVNNWTDIVAIVAGNGYTVGLKSDGTIVTTDVNKNKETSKWTDIVSVCAGDSYIFGVKADGTVVGLKDYDEKQLKDLQNIKVPE